MLFGSASAQMVQNPDPFGFAPGNIMDVGQTVVANTVISNTPQSGPYTGNWQWIPPVANGFAPGNTVSNTLPTTNNAMPLSITATSDTHLTLTFNGVSYTVSAVGANTVEGVWTFNAFAIDQGTSSVSSTNTLQINAAPYISSVSPSGAQILDLGQTAVFNVVLNGGTGPFTFNLVYNNNGIVANTITGIAVGGSARLPFTPTIPTHYYFQVAGNDIGTPVNFGFGTAPQFVTNTMTVGSAPQYVAFNPASTLAYVVNYGSNTVNVINLKTSAIINTIAVGGDPYAAVFNSTGTLAYVTNQGSDTVSVINPATNTVINTITVGTGPEGVAFNPSGTLAYVVNYGSNTVNVINPITSAIINTIAVGGSPEGVAFNPSGTLAYVTNYGSNTVNVINPATNTVINTITVGTGPEGVAFNPSGTLAYVTNQGSDTVSVINPATNTVINTITVGTGPYAAVFNPTGRLAYVTNASTTTGAAGRVSVIDTATNAIIETMAVGSSPTSIAITSASTLAYVVNNYGNTVSIVSTVPFGTVEVHPAPTAFLTESVNAVGTGQPDTLSANVQGGTGPFTFNYIYTNNGVSADYVGSGTSAAFVFVPASANTYTFNVIVTDTATSVPYTFNSAPVAVSVCNFCATKVFSNTVLDISMGYPMETNFMGGVAPYTVNVAWHLSTNSLFGGNTTSQTMSSGPVYFFPIPFFPNVLLTMFNGQNYSTSLVAGPGNTIIGNWIYTVTIKDSAGNTLVMSNTITVEDMPRLAPIAVTHYNIERGQSTAMSVAVTGGSGNFLYRWMYMHPVSFPPSFANVPVGSTFAISGNTLTFTSNAQTDMGGYMFMVQVNDQNTPVQTFIPDMPVAVGVRPDIMGCASVSNVVMNPCGSVFSNTLVDGSQPAITENMPISGGAGTYTVNLIWTGVLGNPNWDPARGGVSGSSGPVVLSDNAVDLTVSSVSNTELVARFSYNSLPIDIFSTGTNEIYGNYTFNVIVSDSSGVAANTAWALNTVMFNPPFRIAVQPAFSTNTITFGTITNFTANAIGGILPYTFTIDMVNAATGALVHSMQMPPMPLPGITFSLFGMPPIPPGTYAANIFITDGATTPVTINSIYSSNIIIPSITQYNISGNTFTGGHMTFYPGVKPVINFSNTDSNLTFALENSSAAFNTTGIKLMNASTTVNNIGLPNGIKEFFASMNVILPANYTIQANASMHYNCSVPSNEIFPYILNGNVWAKLLNFTVNSGGCFITLRIPKDPVLSLFTVYQSGQPASSGGGSGGGGGGGGGGVTCPPSCGTGTSVTTTTTIATTTATTSIPARNINISIHTPGTRQIINVSPGRYVDIHFNNTGTLVSIIAVVNGSVTVVLSNDTANSSRLGVVPTGMSLLSAVNVSAQSSVNVTVNVTQRYNCDYPPSSVAPYRLVNMTSLVKITPFTVNSTACTVAFLVPKDPVVMLLSNYTAPLTSTTVAPTTTVQANATTTIVPTPAANSGFPWWIVAVVIVAAAVAYFVLHRRSK